MTSHSEGYPLPPRGRESGDYAVVSSRLSAWSHTNRTVWNSSLVKALFLLALRPSAASYHDNSRY